MYEQSNQSNNTEPFFEISDLQPLRNQLSRSNSSFNNTSSGKPLETQPQTTTTTTTTVPSTMTTSFNFTTDFVPTTNRSELVLSKKYNFYTWKKNFYLNFSI